MTSQLAGLLEDNYPLFAVSMLEIKLFIPDSGRKTGRTGPYNT